MMPFQSLRPAIALPTTASAGIAALQSETPRLADFRFNEKTSLVSPAVVSGLVRGIEFFVVAALGMLIQVLYVESMAHAGNVAYFVTSVSAAAAGSILFQMLGLYDVAAFRSVWWQLGRLSLGWSIVFALLVTAAFFTKLGPDFSRVWLAAWFATGGVCLVFGRILLGFKVRRWAKAGRFNRRVVIVGGGEDARALIEALEKQDGSDLRICGIFDDRGGDRVAERIGGYPKLGRIGELVEFGRRTRIDLLIVTLPLSAEARIQELLKAMAVLPVDIRLAAHAGRLRFRPQAYSWIANVPFIDLADKPIAGWAHVQKWLFDKIVAAAALTLLAPVMALVALAIKLESKGPILFRQKRYGLNNELVEVLKFRSMYTDRCDANAARLVTRSDSRVTRVGRFIRKTSLDELPQLINVLTGSLSVVGPRPHAMQAKAGNALYPDVVDGYFARHKVKPGVTGWAQINGWRGETDTEEKILKRVEHDLYYIENWSVFFDLYIVLRTPLALAKSENAY
jgi:Undecaprenyl-phosphate glucose phosphotransferase